MKKGRIPIEERGCVKPRSWTIAAHLDLGFRQVSYLGQVLTGTDVGIGPSCKDPFQLQQLPNTESGPLSPMGTQPTGTACGPGWESNQDSLARASSPASKPSSTSTAPTPYLHSSPFTIPPCYSPSPYPPFPHQITWRCFRFHRTGHGAGTGRGVRGPCQGYCPQQAQALGF